MSLRRGVTVGRCPVLELVVAGTELIQELKEHLHGRPSDLLRLTLDLRYPAEGGMAVQSLPQPLGEAALTARVPEVERIRDVVIRQESPDSQPP